MGGGSFSSNDFTTARSTRRAKGLADFGHDADVKSGKAKGIHPDLDPKKVAGPSSPVAGKPIRESRDSDEHPNSIPIAMIFDVTGSMGEIPRMLQEKLPDLMDVIIAKAGVSDPQILVGAVGDSTCDRYPLQIGQFESDNRFDEQLRNIIIEGGGGGQVMESYALAYRFAAYHTITDAFEKRGKKGYLFTMGDEMPWPTVDSEDVKRIFGIKAEKDETVEELLAKAGEQWEIFHLFSMDGSYSGRKDIKDRWRKLLGERFVQVEDSSLVCEIIAGLIHGLESMHDVDKVVKDLGVSGKAAGVVKNALVPVMAARVPAHVAKGARPAKGKGATGGTSRL